jgi:hypothetical protein
VLLRAAAAQENIMLTKPSTADVRVKLVDFGNSFSAREAR